MRKTGNSSPNAAALSEALGKFNKSAEQRAALTDRDHESIAGLRDLARSYTAELVTASYERGYGRFANRAAEIETTIARYLSATTESETRGGFSVPLIESGTVRLHLARVGAEVLQLISTIEAERLEVAEQIVRSTSEQESKLAAALEADPVLEAVCRAIDILDDAAALTEQADGGPGFDRGSYEHLLDVVRRRLSIKRVTSLNVQDVPKMFRNLINRNAKAA